MATNNHLFISTDGSFKAALQKRVAKFFMNADHIVEVYGQPTATDVIITLRCTNGLAGCVNHGALLVTDNDFLKFVRDNEFIQLSFPNMPVDSREWLQVGMCPNCQQAYYDAQSEQEAEFMKRHPGTL